MLSLFAESTTNSNESGSTISSDADANSITHLFSDLEGQGGERTLLDMYSGCGAMSTGLCLGANSCGVKLVTVSLVFPHLLLPPSSYSQACFIIKLLHLSWIDLLPMMLLF